MERRKYDLYLCRKMKFIIKYSIIVMVALLPLLFNCCGKNNDYKLPVYLGFLYPINITPTNDTLHVVDTLWINTDMSDSLYDIGTQKILCAKL